MNRFVLNLIALLLSGLVISGCAAVAAGTAGGVAADELTEEDGQFDPLENTDLGEEIYD
jgi:hypothetical protein